MKNKIIISILIILLSISCRKSNDITGGGNGGNNGGNNGENNNENIRFTKDNFEPPQTNTQAAKDFLLKFNEIKQKYPKAELMLYYRKSNITSDSGYSIYYFDDNANITNIYINGQGNKKTNSIFWGMLPDNPQIACYYYKQNNGDYGTDHSLMYENGLIKNKSRIFDNSGHYADTNIVDKSRDAMFKSAGTSGHDYKTLNTSTTTTENNAYKSKVAGKIIEKKEVMNTYTFLDNGNISVKTSEGKYYTLHFWGATNYYEYLCGIYYIKINLKDIFGSIAPNESTYFYYGYRFEEYKGYKSYLPELRKFWQNRYYCRTFTNWYEEYFYTNGKPKRDIDWATMPLQESQYISFGNTQEYILLMTNK